PSDVDGPAQSSTQNYNESYAESRNKKRSLSTSEKGVSDINDTQNCTKLSINKDGATKNHNIPSVPDKSSSSIKSRRIDVGPFDNSDDEEELVTYNAAVEPQFSAHADDVVFKTEGFVHRFAKFESLETDMTEGTFIVRYLRLFLDRLFDGTDIPAPQWGEKSLKASKEHLNRGGKVERQRIGQKTDCIFTTQLSATLGTELIVYEVVGGPSKEDQTKYAKDRRKVFK
ncbi:hypothetical protein HK100_009048, partial [Physocladia obscura]